MTTKKNNSIKVFITDDHDVVRQGIKTIISDTSDLCVVGEAENGEVALEKIRGLDVDVVIMDYDMPKKNGLDALVELR